MQNSYDAKSLRIVDCKPNIDYTVWIKFADGFQGTVDLSDLAKTEAFSKVWDGSDPFENVRIDPHTHTLTWGFKNELVDVNPQSLREELEQQD